MSERISKVGIASRSRTGWYVIQRPTGRISHRMFQSQYRAAEFAERAYKKTWPELHRDGFLIVGSVTP